MTLQESYDYAVKLSEYYAKSVKKGSPSEDYITGKFLSLVHFAETEEAIL